MTGLLALIGGCEHTPGCEIVDRTLLAAVERPRPVVAIVAAASSRRTSVRTIGNAVHWWERLGAAVLVAPPGDAAATHAALREPDLVVLTGGVPDRLYRRLDGSATWARIQQLWRAGAHLAGSSSGAMILAARRQSVRPPFELLPGFGLLPDAAIGPHHDLLGPRTVLRVRSISHPRLLLVGIDERTALIGRHGRFQVVGGGAVLLARGAWRRRYGPGDEVALPISAVPAPSCSNTELLHDVAGQLGVACGDVPESAPRFELELQPGRAAVRPVASLPEPSAGEQPALA